MQEQSPSSIDPSALDFDMRRHLGEQPLLFPSEDFIVPASVQSMRKAVSAIHAVPVKAEHNHSLNTRRLFDACILVAQLDLKKRDKAQVERIRNERISPMFETRVGDLARLAGIPGKNYQRLYEALDSLFEMVLRWNVVGGPDSSVIWDMKSHFLSSVGVGKGQQRGVIRFSIDPGILDIVLEPSHWATLSLKAMSGLGTPSSYALYQNAWRYLGTQNKVTGCFPTETWVELLVGPSRYVKTDPVSGKLSVNYGDFKRRVLMDAIARVNEVKALTHTLELREFHSGNRVAKLQFKFIPKHQATLGLPVGWPEDILTVLAIMGFDDAAISDMSQLHSYAVIAESLARLQAADTRMRARGKPVVAKKPYFLGILNNVAAGAADEDLEHDRIEAEVRAQERQRLAQVMQDNLRAGFATHQAQTFCRRLFELPEPARMRLFKDFEATEEGARVKATLLQKFGWAPKNVGALSQLRSWIAASRPDLLQELLCEPQDQTMEGWSAWRVFTADTGNATAPPEGGD